MEPCTRLPYAEVAIDLPPRQGPRGEGEPGHQVQTYHYAIPSGMPVQPGQLVWVPLRAQYRQGVVIGLSATSPVVETKEILQVVDPQPFLSRAQLDLATWIARYYLCSLAEAVFLMLPPGVEQRMITYLVPSQAPKGSLPPSLTSAQRDLLALLHLRGRLTLAEVRKAFRRVSQTDAAERANQLVRKGLALKLVEVEPPHVRPKIQRVVRLAGEPTAETLAALKRAPKQRAGASGSGPLLCK